MVGINEKPVDFALSGRSTLRVRQQQLLAARDALVAFVETRAD